VAHRTFSGEDRVKAPTFSLETAVEWYLADKPIDGDGIADSTLRSYERRLYAFLKRHPNATLADLTVDNAERFVRTAKNLNTRRNLAITLRSLASYLAAKKLWYLGDESLRLSVLRDLPIPQASARGQAPYKDSEVTAILRATTDVRERAIIAIELHGFRAKETRMLLLRNVELGRHGGYLAIEEESGTKRGTGGVRRVPLDPAAVRPLLDYLRIRPLYEGDADEPFFLTIHGKPICDSTWGTLTQALRKHVAQEQIAFRQHRLRSTSVTQKSEAGWTDSAIIEVHGWDRKNSGSGMRMLRRYRGEIPLSQLAKYPTTLGKFFGKAS
jgi:integrase